MQWLHWQCEACGEIREALAWRDGCPAVHDGKKCGCAVYKNIGYRHSDGQYQPEPKTEVYVNVHRLLNKEV